MNGSTDILSKLCGDIGPFWDAAITWNTNSPDVTECMKQTVLPWLPSAWLLLVSPLYAWYSVNARSRTLGMPPLRSNWLNITRMILSILIASIWLQEVIRALTAYINDRSGVALIYVITPIAIFLSMCVSALLYQLERRAGYMTSGIQAIFWTLHFLCAIIILQSDIRNGTSSYGLSAANFYAQFTLICLQFILTLVTETPQNLKIAVQQKKVSPEVTASFFSYVTFWWLNDLVFLGHKKTLEESDLWPLNPRDVAARNDCEFEYEWQKEQQRLSHSKRSCSYLDKYRSSQSVLAGNERTPLLSHGGGYGGCDARATASAKEVAVKKPSIYKVLFKVGGPTLFKAHLCKLVCDITVFCGPLIQKQLIEFADNGTDELVWKGYFFASLFFITAAINSAFFHQLFHVGMTLGMRLKSALICAVYNKALTMNSEASRKSTVGEIVNLMSVDAQRIQDVTGVIWMIWSCPLQICVSIIMLYSIIGPSVFAGVLIMVVLIPINAAIATKQKRLQLKQMKLKDERIKMMNEVLNGIKVLKLYAWEKSFQDKVTKIRTEELANLKVYSFLSAYGSFIWACAPFFITLATFITFVLMGGVLTAEIAFVSLSLFNILRFPISLLPMIISNIVTAIVSLKRLNSFLHNEDIEFDNVTRDDSNIFAVFISNGDFAWGTKEEDTAILKSINLKIDVGSLTAVVGRVGEGKSSLISAILGEMYKLSGRVNVKGSVAYIAQQAWIQNATVRDNILFCTPYDEARYNSVIEACALTSDLEMLPAGDLTEIGEKGINLSGGQKQRVSLARAVYADADIYLFDDPLSALDAHVGKHVFDKVVGPNGILKDKTRILVTHGIHWLPSVDSIVVLDDGRISEHDTYDNLLATVGGAFAAFLRQHLSAREGEEEEEEEEVSDQERRDSSDDETVPTTESEKSEDEVARQRMEIKKRLESMSGYDENILSSSCDNSSLIKPILKKRKKSKLQTKSSKLSTKSASKSSSSIVTEAPKKVTLPNEQGNDKKDGKLIDKEKEQVGKVNLSVFLYYLRSLGVFAALSSFSMYVVYSCLSLYSAIWLSKWTEDPVLQNSTSDPTSYTDTRNMYLGVYAGLGIGQAIFMLIYSLGFAICTVRGSKHMHFGMLSNILRSPMSFFETTPIGRILNRFSRDIETIDNILPQLFRSWIGTTFTVLSTIIVISYSTPIFIAVVLPLSILYYMVQRFYIPTSRQLKRIESTTRSPIYVHFSETITGASTIRAYRKQRDFIEASQNGVDHNQVFYFASIASNRWIGMRLEFIGTLVVLSAALFAVFSRGSISSGLVGLSITYALQVTSGLNWMVRMTSDLETNVVSVERTKEYTESKPEAEWEKPSDDDIPDWPRSGKVEFENYETRYREGLDLVLKGITLNIKSGEKIGVVGRTGAGKSSLTLSLFRIIEGAAGRILIDDQPIDQLGLHKLRRNVTILPQDPVIFSGTLRMNLDPCDLHSEPELWTVLEHAQLKQFVENLPAGLEYECGETGSNLSVGQRQLLCLARTLLRKSAILVLDEATAAIDLDTDRFVQETVRSQCAESTVITIAHRLNTIIDSDRVMVLDCGKVVEFDEPSQLLKNKKSIFHGMAKDAGMIS